jgi:hypothetical protein
MTVAYVLLPLGALLLVVPSILLTSEKVRQKMRKAARRHEFGLASLVRTPVNWIDLARAAAGAWMIQYALPLGGTGQSELSIADLSAQIAIVVVAVVVQTIWFERPLRVIGPIFYLSGLALVLCGPLVGGFALCLGIGCSLMLRRLSLCFFLVPVAIIGFARVFGQVEFMMSATAAAFLLPLVLSFGMKSRIAFARRPVESPSAGRVSPDSMAPAEQPEGTPSAIAPDFNSSHLKMAEESLA